MEEDIEQVLVTEEEIAGKVAALGAQLANEYNGLRPIFVGILNGAVMFLADLVRACPIHLTTDFMDVSSYGGASHSTGVVRILKDLDTNIEGRHVLIVEDIIDTGLTLSYLMEHLQARHPASLKLCALLDKRSRRLVDVPIDYPGFVVPDEFVVGYGLDYDGLYRNLPYIGVLKPSLYTS